MKQGFSLLEVMVAVAVLAIALVCLCSTLISSMVLNQNAKEYDIALNAARAKLQEWQTSTSSGNTYTAHVITDRLALSETWETNFDVPGLNISLHDSHGSSTMAGYVRITCIANDATLVGPPDLQHTLANIQIIVEWRGRHGRDLKVEVSGRLSRHQ